MRKFLKVFYSQLFNSFFPIALIAILLSLKNKNDIAYIFLILNFSNFYLLFSDYSSNVKLLQESMEHGGIKNIPVHHTIVENIHAYIGIKAIFLSLGFIIWIFLCYSIPLLYEHFFSNCLAYTFIIGFNLNYYWIYISSNKEHFFVLSNFIARISVIVFLLIFIYLGYNLLYLMFWAGILAIITNTYIFKSFLRRFEINQRFDFQKIYSCSIKVIKRDYKFVTNNFLVMTPTNCINYFIGYINKTELILIYAFAEKIFFAIRALLSVFLSSLYPVFFQKSSMSKKKKILIFTLFYIAIFFVCTTTYFLPYKTLLPILKIEIDLAVFYPVMKYFIFTILVISLNVPFFLWLIVNNRINTNKTLAFLLIATICIIGVFIAYLKYDNHILSIAKSLLIAESLFALIFIALFMIERIKKPAFNN